MDRKKILTYSGCVCCGKTFNLNDLIETSSNSLLIGRQTIDISDLILELFLKKVNSEILKITFIHNFIDYHCSLNWMQKTIFASSVKIISCSSTYSKTMSKIVKTSIKG